MRRSLVGIGVVSAVLIAGSWALWPEPAPPPEVAERAPREEPERERIVAPIPRPEPRSDEVVCEVGRALEGRRCHVRVGPPISFRPKDLPGQYDGNTWTFRPPMALGLGELVCVGLEDPVPLRWNPQGECLFTGPLPPPADAPLFGEVAGAADLADGTVFLEGCGASKEDPIDADGRFFVLTTPGRCSMRAWRRAGKLKLQGPWVQVEALSGVEVEVALAVPTFEPAGLGVRVRSVSEGIEITSVFEGSPAAAVGMMRGDVLTAIDGVPVDGMAPGEFMQLGMGPSGSTVHVEGFDVDGQPFDAVIRRALIRPEE